MDTTQQPTDLTAEEAKAAMGNATFLQDQLLSTMGDPMMQEGATESQDAPGQEQTGQPTESEGGDLESVKNEIIEEIRSPIKDEIEEIRKQLQELIGDDEDGE